VATLPDPALTSSPSNYPPPSSANTYKSFPCADLARDAAVEQLQGAPPSEEKPRLPAGADAPALEMPPEAALTPCETATAPADPRWTPTDAGQPLPVSLPATRMS
jgi:hypothetical protein